MGTGAVKQFNWADVFAGVSVAGVLLPEAVAYAAIAQVPTGHALIAALVGLFVYPWLGASRFAIVAPTSSAAAVFASAAMDGGPHMGYALVMLTAALFLLAGALRIEFIGAFISRPVLRGFAWGLALTIMAKQLPHILGVHASGATLREVAFHLWPELANIHQLSLMCGGGALLLWVLLHGSVRRWQWLPTSLVVLALGVVVSAVADLGHQGVALVGAIDWENLRPTVPDITADNWLRAAELAPALLLILFAESWGSVRTLALQRGDDIAPRSELLALGGANLVSGLLQGLPVGAGFSAASANSGAGARSQWAGVVAALALVLMLWLARDWLALLPVPVLAAVVVGILSHNLWPRVLIEKLSLGGDAWLGLVAAAGVVAFGVLFGMLLAVGLSVVVALKRFSSPMVVVLGRLPGTRDFVDVGQHTEAELTPGLLVMRPDEPLFFANAETVLKYVQRVARQQNADHVVVSLEMSDRLDSTALEALSEFAHSLWAEGRSLSLARVKDAARDGLHRCGLAQTRKTTRMAGMPEDYSESPVPLYWSVDDAVSSHVFSAGVGAAAPKP